MNITPEAFEEIEHLMRNAMILAQDAKAAQIKAGRAAETLAQALVDMRVDAMVAEGAPRCLVRDTL